MDTKGMVCLDLKQKPFEITGMPWLEETGRFERIPRNLMQGMPQMTIDLASDTSGGTARIRTNSRHIYFEAEVTEVKTILYHMSRAGHSGFDFYIQRDGDKRRFLEVTELGYGETVLTRDVCVLRSGWLDARPTDNVPTEMYELYINFPIYNGVKWARMWFDKGSIIEAPKPRKYERPILFYGSSITQGACASRPSAAYTNHLSMLLDCPIIDFGFSGAAMGEQQMAQLIADLDFSVFVMDYDHNAPAVDHLLRTHEPFYRTVRNSHPETPIIMISKPDFGTSLDENGPRREVIRTTYEHARKEGDHNVWFVDGEQFFADNREFCTVDGCHPNDLGFSKMTETLYPLLNSILENNGK